MSTKIYHGYTLPLTNHASFPTVLQYLGRKRKSIVSRAERDGTEVVTRMSVYNLDATFLGRNKDKKSSGSCALVNAMTHISEQARIVKERQIRSPYDWSCSVVVLKGRHRLLALLFCENERLERIMRSILEPYPYWDNTDPPDDVPRKEWKARGQEWEEALGWDAPNKRGMTYTYIEDGWFPMPLLPQVRKVLDSKPKWADLNARADYQAKDILLTKAYKAENKSLIKTINDMSSGKGKQKVDKLAEKLRPRLKPVVSPEDLSTNMKELMRHG